MDPRASVESRTLHHQSVFVPMSDRVTHKARVGIGFERAAVHEDRAVGKVFVQDDDHRGSLDDPFRSSVGAVARAFRQTFVPRIVLTEILAALLHQRLRPGLDIGGLEVPDVAGPDVANRRIDGRAPQTRKIRLAIGGARRRGGEIRFAIGGARNARRGVMQPLRREWCRERSNDHRGGENFHGSLNATYSPLYP